MCVLAICVWLCCNCLYKAEKIRIYTLHTLFCAVKIFFTDKSSEQMAVEVASGVNQPDQVQEISPDLPKSANKSIQAYIPKKYRSKSSQTRIRKRNSVTSPLKVGKVNIAISPIKNIAPSKSGAIRKLTFIEKEASESEISISPSVSDSSPSLKSVKITSDSSSNIEKIKAVEEFKKQLN